MNRLPAEKMATLAMDEKRFPFSGLTPRAFDDIVARARRERHRAIAAAFAWLLRRIATGIAALSGATPAERRWKQPDLSS